MSDELNRAFHRSVDEGRDRLKRSLPSLLATGAVGGLDVSMGLFALLIVRRHTEGPLLGALAFGLGFIALTLAGSELFTENFLVPVTAVAVKKAPWISLPRLWLGTVMTNLAGGWVAMALVMLAFPELRSTASAVASHPATAGIGGASFASAVLAGMVITLMTWIERSTESVSARLVVAVGAAFVLAAAPLLHAVVVSIEMFAALQAGAAFGYASWLGVLGWATLGNMVGGLGLVTLLRLIQVGPEEFAKERDRPSGQPREDDDGPA